MTSILSWFPQRVLRSSDTLLRSGKRVSSAGSSTSVLGKRKASCLDMAVLNLPEEILEGFLTGLDARDLCSMAQACPRFKQLAYCEANWRTLFLDRWGPAVELLEQASILAGGWRQLYQAKHVCERNATPWQKPCCWEIEAAVQKIARQPSSQKATGLAVVFLLDGSGSVTEEDFKEMTKFIGQAVDSICSLQRDCKVGVIQFSNDVRVELAPQSLDSPDQMATLLASMTRMNGGTNIAVSIQKAGQLLKNVEPTSSRVMVLLTDGRVDPYQGREAVEMAERLADEQANVSMFAFGVGRGVERGELEKIIAACGAGADAASQYMGLCVLDDAPW